MAQSVARAALLDSAALVAERLERDEDEALELLQAQASLLLAQRRLERRAREDAFGILEAFSEEDEGARALPLRVALEDEQEAGGVREVRAWLERIPDAECGPGEGLRVAMTHSWRAREVSLALEVVSRLPLEGPGRVSLQRRTLLCFSGAWRCETHGLEECQLVSEREMACAACDEAVPSPFELSLEVPEGLPAWLGLEGDCGVESALLAVLTIAPGLDAIRGLLADAFLGESDAEGDGEEGEEEEEEAASKKRRISK